MRNKIILIAIIVILSGGIALKLAANKKSIEAKKEKITETPAIPVNTIIAQKEIAQENLIKSGKLIPYKKADITSVSGGKLVAVNFELGDYVSAGQVLATIDNSGLQLSLEAAQLAHQKAEKDYKRFQALLEGEATTEMNYQDAKFNFQHTQNQIKQIEKQMSDNRIKAPISGQIVAKIKEIGEFVGPGSVVGQVVNVNQLKVEVMVSEQEVYNLKLNGSVSISTDVYPGIDFDGKITFISESGDEVHNYKVEVALENKKDNRLKAGSFAYVDFHLTQQEESIIIPKSALIQSLDNPMVYVVENGMAKTRKIITGKSIGNNIIVVEGIVEGEEIITSGLVNVSDETKVNPTN